MSIKTVAVAGSIALGVGVAGVVGAANAIAEADGLSVRSMCR